MEKPVVTTDVPGCRDRVKDGYNGFLVPIKDAVSLASAVERLILDKGLRVKMGINGRKMAINKFSSKFVVKQVMGIYNKLIPDRCLL
jgi:glycosyltransferase involved in cell wall biosynthesis